MSTEGQIATGSQYRIAYGHGRPHPVGHPGASYGIPKAGAVAIRPDPSSKMYLRSSTQDRGLLNPFGFKEKGQPGPYTGGLELGSELTSGSALEWIDNVCPGGAKTPDIGRHAYLFSPNGKAPQSHLWGYDSLSPVDGGFFYGIMAGGIEFDWSATILKWKLVDARPTHGTDLNLATAHAGNTGTLPEIPYVRGFLKFPELGPLHIQVSDATPGAMKVKFHQGPADSVDFPGPSIPLTYSPITGQHCFQSAQGAIRMPGTVSVAAGATALTGTDTQFLRFFRPGIKIWAGGQELQILSIADNTTATLAAAAGAAVNDGAFDLLNQDLGTVKGELVDPLEFVIPGVAADHAAALVGDRWELGEWVDPIPLYPDMGPALTAAGVRIYYKAPWETQFRTADNTSGKITLSWPITSTTRGQLREGRLDRTGLAMLGIELKRDFRTTDLADFADRHQSFEMRVEMLGEQLGDGSVRDGLIFDIPGAHVTEDQVSISGTGPVEEDLNIDSGSDSQGSVPFTLLVNSARDYTLFADAA